MAQKVKFNSETPYKELFDHYGYIMITGGWFNDKSEDALKDVIINNFTLDAIKSAKLLELLGAQEYNTWIEGVLNP